MSILSLFDERTVILWNRFIAEEALSAYQADQFISYLKMLIMWSKNINLTTITVPASVIKYHFQDSLRVDKAIDMKTITIACDIGTGGGFPGIPLKIKYPHLKIVLIEVNNKKITFLNEVIAELKLKDISIASQDWRTFLRTTDYDIDLFCARASLQPDELIRMFKPSSPYKNSLCIYWASIEWHPDKKTSPFIHSNMPYEVGNKKRRLFLLKKDA